MQKLNAQICVIFCDTKHLIDELLTALLAVSPRQLVKLDVVELSLKSALEGREVIDTAPYMKTCELHVVSVRLNADLFEQVSDTLVLLEVHLDLVVTY